MKEAIIYVRVSSKEQKQEGYSIPAQKKLLADYAKANGFVVAKEFEDDETAKSAGRTNFGEMVKYIKAHKEVKTILVEKTDRLYRNLKDWVTIDELGVEIHLVKENVKIDKESRSDQKFIHGINILMAKRYIDNLSEEVRKGLNQKADEGLFPGVPPVGYKLERVDGKSLVKVDEKTKYLPIKLFEYYATGLYSLVSLRAKAEADGLLSGNLKNTKVKKLTKTSIHRLLSNPFYYGDFLWNKILYHGKHEPLITKEKWNKVQKILGRYENKGMPYRFKNNTTLFPFKRLLTCGECGRNITAEKKVKKSGKEYTYYRCTKFKTNCHQPAVNETALEGQVQSALNALKVPRDAQEYISGELKQSYNIKRNTEDVIKQNLETRKKQLEDRLKVLYEDRLDKVIMPDFYHDKFTEISNEVSELNDKIYLYTKADLNYYSFGLRILELSYNIGFLYENGNPEEKQEFMNFMLSNSKLKDGKILISYKKPFDYIYQRALHSDWRANRVK